MFDITIIGGGHAGVEAAYIASQFESLKIAIITLPGVGLASAPCNPAIGGVGKGQVVREIDALGGVMGKLADLSGIQFRVLNESKGYAVQSTRIQIDKDLYSKNAEAIVDSIPNIEVIREKVQGIDKTNETFEIKTESSTWNSKKVIFTVGTFLNAKTHLGEIQKEEGRVDCESSKSLTSIFKDINLVGGRFKTGTPARLYKDSIDYDKLQIQESDPSVNTFHVLHGTNERFLDQVSCYITYTNDKTLKSIRDNKERSPMFNGQINGVGARYCPSIEDKAYRYPDKNKHHVFIEPEGHERDTVYPSGISTSLPKEVQEEFYPSIEGLESCKIETYGYAVEYDVVDTTKLNYSLEIKELPGVYFAGQVNGTSGYEEAAGQGFIAGANAALNLLGKEPLILSRRDSYIGVMIEDLISNMRDEPYRLFTARSENRLYIREDNAINRIHKYRQHLGLYSTIDQYQENYLESFETHLDIIKSFYISPGDKFLKEHNINVPRRISLDELIKQANLDPIETLKNYFVFNGFEVDPRLVSSLAITLKYEGYINKANEQYKKVAKVDDKKINWEKLIDSENISFECKQRIQKIRPETFSQLKIIEGIRPATLAVVASDSY